jgi:death-on-curing protein|tara:strand:- start:502 stop:675 length:174 start_codon:yes stop_codon:yes gene_type:complete
MLRRTAFAATSVFLAINELEVTATDDQAQDSILGLYRASSVTFDNLRAWLSENTKVL